MPKAGFSWHVWVSGSCGYSLSTRCFGPHLPPPLSSCQQTAWELKLPLCTWEKEFVPLLSCTPTPHRTSPAPIFVLSPEHQQAGGGHGQHGAHSRELCSISTPPCKCGDLQGLTQANWSTPRQPGWVGWGSKQSTSLLSDAFKPPSSWGSWGATCRQNATYQQDPVCAALSLVQPGDGPGSQHQLGTCCCSGVLQWGLWLMQHLLHARPFSAVCKPWIQSWVCPVPPTAWAACAHPHPILESLALLGVWVGMFPSTLEEQCVGEPGYQLGKVLSCSWSISVTDLKNQCVWFPEVLAPLGMWNSPMCDPAKTSLWCQEGLCSHVWVTEHRSE